ncbi:MAG: hypothetical protein J7513_00410 [Solirubrobacteraceae bacterium]|nr:hypothetical protein [Solirubrobacteraceae bacterium]
MTVPSRPLARTLGAALATTALLGTTAPVVSAQSCVGRPGASALQQYCEAVPEANGDRQKPQSSSSKDGGSTGDNLPSSSKRVLGKAGDDGAAVAALAAAAGGGSGGAGGDSGGDGASGGSRSSDGSSGASSESSGSGSSVAPPSAPSGSALAAAKQAVETGPTAGPALAWSLLGMSVLGAIGALFLRRRGATLTPVADGDET